MKVRAARAITLCIRHKRTHHDVHNTVVYKRDWLNVARVCQRCAILTASVPHPIYATNIMRARAYLVLLPHAVAHIELKMCAARKQHNAGK